MIDGELMKKLNQIALEKHPDPEVQAEIEQYQRLNEAVHKLKYQLRTAEYNESDTVGLEKNIELAEKVRDEAAIELEKKGVSTEGLKPDPVSAN